MMINFTLNLNNLKSLPLDKYHRDFTFIVDGKRYQTNRIVADLLSPIIRNYHYQDPTIDEYVINTKEISNNDDYFQEFLNLCNFNQHSIDKTKQKLFSQYFIHLGNINEYLQLQPDFFDQLSSENIIEHIKILFENFKIKELKQNENEILLTGENYEQLINFAAAHFDEIKKEEIKNLDKNIIEEIISSESLQLEKEDDLLQFILDLYQNDHKFYNFFEYVEFQNVDEKMLEDFINIFSIDDLSIGIWKSICKRLLPSKNKNNKEDNKRYNFVNVIEKEYKEGQEFEGIMHHLSDEIGGNIHDKGIVEIKSNSINDSNRHASNIVNYKENTYYDSSHSIENATLCFDFKSNKIQITDYALKSSASNCHLKNWVVEVSNDGENWEKIDEHVNDSTLKNKSVAVFKTKKQDDFYRYIQLRQTGESWSGDYYFAIYCFDIFGKLKIFNK